MLRLIPALQLLKKLNVRAFSSQITGSSGYTDTTYLEIPIPLYDINKPQTLEKRKARLHYQSRKRGMLENDLMLSTFAKKYLDGFTEQQTMMYDRLINSPSNDWDIFYWMIEKQPTPKEFDNEVMDLLKKHAKNEEKELRKQPNLY